ncbi:hypothetical protein LG634_06005 [Streptomyces bambusae]|uniref:hypothetical protein n=1 Tax=Streptomyces bambusae TaxID=1550616 RepID=UPI001CFEA3E5|nr:hypothetical protein [Streptomyces bambusae]MCB5164388.1 hypothetical protein [Streptomyces bambusae]
MNPRLRPTTRSRRSSRFLAAAAVAGLLLTGCDDGSPERAAPTGGPSRTPSQPPSSPQATGERTAPAPTGPAASRSATAEPPLGAGLHPLWPFATYAQAQAWQRSYREGGHQPWHLEADRTALAFVQGYLGFREIDRVSSRSVSGRHARIGVGPSAPEEARRSTAAVIHLVRYGPGADAPWEVVGTDDTTFSLTVPAYGATARSPLRAGGRITGVDESIRVQVRQPSSARPLGTGCCTPAGGSDRPWTATVSYTRPTDPVLTVVASTGGHVTEVERFTVTAVRSR